MMPIDPIWISFYKNYWFSNDRLDWQTIWCCCRCSLVLSPSEVLVCGTKLDLLAQFFTGRWGTSTSTSTTAGASDFSKDFAIGRWGLQRRRRGCLPSTRRGRTSVRPSHGTEKCEKKERGIQTKNDHSSSSSPTSMRYSAANHSWITDHLPRRSPTIESISPSIHTNIACIQWQ